MGVLGAVGLAAEAEQAAAHAIGEAMVATSGVIDGAGFSELLGHGWFSFLSEMGFDTRWFCIDEKTKELLDEGFAKR